MHTFRTSSLGWFWLCCKQQPLRTTILRTGPHTLQRFRDFVEVMAFISSFKGTQLLQSPQYQKTNVCIARSPRASSTRRLDDDFNFPPLNSKTNRNFEPFDGSTPLLPQWRPPSVEAEFNYSAKRVVSREQQSRQPVKKVVKVTSHGFGTLFAEVVQEIDEGEGKMWLRPLLLDNDEQGDDTFVDLRGGSDLVLSRSCVTEVDVETKMRVAINMMATESDLIDRALSDEQWNETGANALIAFMRGISSNQTE